MTEQNVSLIELNYLLTSLSSLAKYNLNSGRKSRKSPNCRKSKKSLQK